MMDWSDRHCRFFHRIITRHALLYTEMVTAEAILHGKRDLLLGFSPLEHPIALQLGGSDPAKLAEAARIGADYGYDEINLNVGCPSDRVQEGRFGACLMAEPQLVATCVAAMRAAVQIPVTVKCRIGIDDQDSEHDFQTFIDTVAAAGCTTFVVHARKAWLKGLSPKENRDIPPLDYDRVQRLKASRPELTIVLNGGLSSLAEALLHRGALDGVMLGRAAYQTPCRSAHVRRRAKRADTACRAGDGISLYGGASGARRPPQQHRAARARAVPWGTWRARLPAHPVRRCRQGWRRHRGRAACAGIRAAWERGRGGVMQFVGRNRPLHPYCAALRVVVW
jgi:tRNA-dihydrouridine synthase A